MSTNLFNVKELADYKSQKDQLVDFLKNYKSTNNVAAEEFEEDAETVREPGPKYMRVLQRIADRQSSTLVFELQDLLEYSEDRRLLNDILNNTKSYSNLICKAVDEAMPSPITDIGDEEGVLDVIMHQRRARNAALQAESNNLAMAAEHPFPSELTRRYNVYFKPIASSYKVSARAFAVREIRGEHLGKFITVRGIATRVSDVKPSVLVNAYTCDRCGSEVFQEFRGKQFVPLVDCRSYDCLLNNS